VVVKQEDDSRVMMDELDWAECSVDVWMASQGVYMRNGKWREWKQVIF
jgi:hypothetical protein